MIFTIQLHQDILPHFSGEGTLKEKVLMHFRWPAKKHTHVSIKNSPLDKLVKSRQPLLKCNSKDESISGKMMSATNNLCPRNHLEVWTFCNQATMDWELLVLDPFPKIFLLCDLNVSTSIIKAYDMVILAHITRKAPLIPMYYLCHFVLSFCINSGHFSIRSHKDATDQTIKM